MGDFTDNFSLKHHGRFWIAVILLGVSFDFLFWEKGPGVNVVVFVSLLLGALFAVLASEKIRPARRSLPLLVPIAFFSVMSLMRLEPMTAFLSIMSIITLVAILAVTYVGGGWLRYGVLEYPARLIFLLFSMMFGGLFVAFNTGRRKRQSPRTGADLSRIWAIVRGILIALPIIVIFTLLLASADAIFAQRVGDITDIFEIDNLGEYAARAALITFVAYVLMGLFAYAARQSQDREPVIDESILPRFLGFTEAMIVFGSVIVLFGAFVIVQFRYFFGGAENVLVDGMTYSEYARRGFGELVAVAIFSLLLLLVLNAFTRRPEKRQKLLFSILGAGVMLLVLVILVSAYQRMMLYESAYGFSRLRTYTNVFIIWLGILLVGVVVLEIIERQRVFALAFLVTSLGFVASLNVLNVDGFVVRRNIQRVADGHELDQDYLRSLSADAVSELAAAFRSSTLPEAEQDELREVLKEFAASSAEERDGPWQSFHLSRWQTDQELEDLRGKLD